MVLLNPIGNRAKGHSPGWCNGFLSSKRFRSNRPQGRQSDGHTQPSQEAPTRPIVRILFLKTAHSSDDTRPSNDEVKRQVHSTNPKKESLNQGQYVCSLEGRRMSLKDLSLLVAQWALGLPLKSKNINWKDCRTSPINAHAPSGKEAMTQLRESRFWNVHQNFPWKQQCDPTSAHHNIPHPAL